MDLYSEEDIACTSQVLLEMSSGFVRVTPFSPLSDWPDVSIIHELFLYTCKLYMFLNRITFMIIFSSTLYQTVPSVFHTSVLDNSLPVYKGSLMRDQYRKLHDMTHTTSL